MELKKVNILGVKIDDISMDQAVEIVVGWLKGNGQHFIVTPNPEFVMAAQVDEEFKRILNNADLAIPDGVGLKIGSDTENTIAGVDFLERLCKVSSESGFTTGFLGGRYEVAKKAAECLKKNYPGLKVIFAEDGGEVDEMGNVLSSMYTDPLPKIDLLLVAFGQVKQEKWIAKNLPHLPVKVAMGVGGSFDEISGRAPRIPGWVQNMGLKWLVRLILEPRRVKRQLALLKFVWLVMVRR